MNAPIKITVHYSSVDGFSCRRTYRTLDRAQKYAREMVGRHPDIGHSYAVSDDGVGKVQVTGCTLATLFPEAA